MSEKLERGIDALRGQVDSKVDAFFSSCVHCGICAESCLFYTETEDPRYTPIYKAMPLYKAWKEDYTFWGKFTKKLGLNKPWEDEDLSDWEELVYDGCSMCGRCSMVCPVGIDVADMIYRVKQGLEVAGYSPQDLVGAANRAMEFGGPMGNIFPALKAHIRHIEDDTGLTVPIDVEGVDYMATISANEIVVFPEYIAALTRIFDHAGVTWTISSEAFEATNSGLQLGDNKIAAELIERIVSAAEKLKVKNVVSPECGHAYSAIRWNGPNFIGRSYSFGVVHILELLDELYRDGRLKTSGMDHSKMTFHDPCQLVRRGGVDAEPHELLNSVADNVVEMKEHGRMNWCCGGGGGVSAIERAEDLRIKVFNRKKAQLDELDVETVVTACSNCRTVLEDGLNANDMNIPVVGLTEMIADHLVEDNANMEAQISTASKHSGSESVSVQNLSDDQLSNESGANIPATDSSSVAVKDTVKKETAPQNVSRTQDNLKKIEGIGPKIEEILKAGGITTFSILSTSKYDDLKALLNEAGSRYKMHDPKTWPQQAELADKGAWSELSDLQDHLLGGRE